MLSDLDPERLQTEDLNKDEAFSSILMFAAAHSADAGESRLGEPSGGRGRGRGQAFCTTQEFRSKLGMKKPNCGCSSKLLILPLTAS